MKKKAKEITISVRHHDGKVEKVTYADAIAIYERRLAAASTAEERDHCEKRIAELEIRWKKALKGSVERQTDTRTR